MSAVALALVLAAAVLHAYWNYLAKRASGGIPFVWLFAGLAAAFYSPVAAVTVAVSKPHLGPMNLLLIGASAAVHSAYFLLLDLAYRTGDMSLAYPVARGTGPLLSAAAGIVFLGERPSAVALAGIALMITGIWVLAGGSGRAATSADRRTVLYAGLCGATIALYTTLDKVSVSRLGTPPILLDWGSNFGRFLILAPAALRNVAGVREEWRTHRREAVGVALLCPFTYILILTAMATAPVSYIAPARETSILVANLMSSKLLGERRAKARMLGAIAVVAGLIALAVG